MIKIESFFYVYMILDTANLIFLVSAVVIWIFVGRKIIDSGVKKYIFDRHNLSEEEYKNKFGAVENFLLLAVAIIFIPVFLNKLNILVAILIIVALFILSLIALDIFFKIKLKKQYNFSSFSCRQSRQITIHSNFHQFLSDVRKITKELGMEIIVDNNKGEINATTRTTPYSWGEKILIKILDKGNNNLDLQITSKPAVGTTIVDYGKNIINVEEFVKKVKERYV